MKTPPILSTNNYALFDSHEYQQPMSEAHILALAESIEQHGFMPANPIQVYENPNKPGHFIIIDGHHRVKAAELANAFVYYVVCPEEQKNLIGDINVLVKKWRTESFIEMYAKQGKKDYVILQSYLGRGIPTSTLIVMLGDVGNGAKLKGASYMKLVQKGQYQVKSEKVVQAVLYVLERTKETCPALGTTARYILTLSHFIQLKEFDVDHFIERVNVNPMAVIPVATYPQAQAVLEGIYNYRLNAANRVPLVLLYQESVRRNQAEQAKRVFPKRTRQGQFGT